MSFAAEPGVSSTERGEVIPSPRRLSTMSWIRAMTEKETIRRLATGVPGFDEVLGGGLPELSFNLIAGLPGSGKTTLAHQMMFSLATPERRAI